MSNDRVLIKCCSHGVTCVRILAITLSKDVWSVSSWKCLPKRKHWNFCMVQATGNDSSSITTYVLFLSVAGGSFSKINFGDLLVWGLHQDPSGLYLFARWEAGKDYIISILMHWWSHLLWLHMPLYILGPIKMVHFSWWTHWSCHQALQILGSIYLYNCAYPKHWRSITMVGCGILLMAWALSSYSFVHQIWKLSQRN